MAATEADILLSAMVAVAVAVIATIAVVAVASAVVSWPGQAVASRHTKRILRIIVMVGGCGVAEVGL